MADINDTEYADRLTQEEIEKFVQKKQKALEEVLVVPAELIKLYKIHSTNNFDLMIDRESFFTIRGSSDGKIKGAETDRKLKQISTYAVIIRNGLVFVYQRKPKTADHRLHAKWSIGIGGHVNKCDGKGMSAVRNAFIREIQEETGIYPNKYHPKTILIDVPGKKEEKNISDYHLGYCKIVTDIGNQEIKESREVGNYGWMKLSDLMKLDLEEWSAWLLDVLEKDFSDLLEV